MVRQWQELFFERRYSNTEMINPDFVKLSEAYSVPARKVSERSELMDGLRQMIETPGPFLLEVVVEKETNVFPMVPSGASVADIRLEA
jgi:acetolactate synthase-1/2/3 large subunit